MNSNTIGYMDIVVAVGHVFVSLETYHILLSSITAESSRGRTSTNDPIYFGKYCI
jgi:hypothetical protein